MNISEILLQWYTFNKRELPWRETDDPYLIWLSEIILQQTRVEQGLPYYLRFSKVFPRITDLAKAKEDKVLKLWQGLGYYSRAINLHFTAKYISRYYEGVFPKEYNDILKLKGVGTYTAAAISSFSFGLPYSVLDGNVIRVLSRIFGIEEPFDTTLGKRQYQYLAQDLLDKNNPSEHNQAIMEFGALQCTPKSPKCSFCPLISNCVAYNTNSIEKYPVRSKRIKIKKRFLNYLLIQTKNSIILEKRNKEQIWRGLYELPFIEYLTKKPEDAVLISDEWNKFFGKADYNLELISDEFVHKLSHQHIYAKFWIVNVSDSDFGGYNFVKKSELNSYPVSRLTDKFLKGYNII